MKNKFKGVDGKDSSGNNAFITVRKEKGKILVFSSEECSDVILTTKQARQLIALLEETVKE